MNTSFFTHLRNSTLLSACLALGLASLTPALASETSTATTSTTTETEEPREDARETDSSMEGEVDPEVLELGRTVFLDEAKPSCKTCHVLEDAEAKGRVGPNLDEMKPDVEMVRNALLSGPGAMPEYGERLDEEQIEAVSQYVAAVSGGEDDSSSDDDAATEASGGATEEDAVTDEDAGAQAD